MVSYFKGLDRGSVRGEGKAEFGQLEARQEETKAGRPLCKMCRHGRNGRALILKINVITVVVRTPHIWLPG